MRSLRHDNRDVHCGDNDFPKLTKKVSMTTLLDHRIWQDVYRPSTQAGEVYLKLTVIEDVLIVSFKEL